MASLTKRRGCVAILAKRVVSLTRRVASLTKRVASLTRKLDCCPFYSTCCELVVVRSIRHMVSWTLSVLLDMWRVGCCPFHLPY
ncbi:hypothetical protein F2Q68_00025534 [Brassica cretica]|uniref:Uncharacterized protein n=1 Tax=Brassica cretica TaxID=69181 RepID=A0A8S9IEY1_BRACR|nr:hypothetical protein F2Q68_00025534 [Brassica cretica]